MSDVFNSTASSSSFEVLDGLSAFASGSRTPGAGGGFATRNASSATKFQTMKAITEQDSFETNWKPSPEYQTAEIGETYINLTTTGENQGDIVHTVRNEEGYIRSEGQEVYGELSSLQDEEIGSSESYENWSFETNMSNPPCQNEFYTVQDDTVHMIGNQDFHSAAEITEIIDLNASQNNIHPMSDNKLVTMAADADEFRSPVVYSIAFNSVSYAKSQLSAAISNTYSRLQSVGSECGFTACNSDRSYQKNCAPSNAAIITSTSPEALGLTFVPLAEPSHCDPKPVSSSVFQVQERIIPSPIEMFRSSVLLPNNRFRFHIVYSVMANLRYESIKLLPKCTAKRKVLVPWMVTECLVACIEDKDGDDSSKSVAFNTPAHSPNSRLELDCIACRKQFYHSESLISQNTVTGNKSLNKLESQGYAEVASIMEFNGGSRSLSRVTINGEVIWEPSLGALVEGDVAEGVDFEASSNQTSKQVLVGSSTDLGGSANDYAIAKDVTENSHVTENSNQESVRGNSFAVAPPEEAQQHMDVQTLPNPNPQRSFSMVSHSLRTHREKSFTYQGTETRRGLARFFSLWRRKTKRNNVTAASRKLTIEAFGDRLSSPSTYEEGTTSRRSSIFGRRFSRSQSRGGKHSSSHRFSPADVDTMVERVYNNFQSDTEFQMMIMNFRSRAKLKKPKHGARVNVHEDMVLSSSSATLLFRNFYPQLKQMKRKQQKVVVNRVLGRNAHCNDIVNEALIMNALRSPQ